jgi:aminoglycoside phosphotransferase (APT) family kinase protein
VEIDDRRTSADELGPAIASGRDATVYEHGPDQVLRQTPTPRDLTGEAAVMEHVRAAGYPAPQVFRVGSGEMVMARIEGPTMLDDLAAHPWRLDGQARTLADLHTRLHEIEPPEGLRAHPVTGTALLHQDLHPGNVICSPDGPVVIDWTNAVQGDAAVDVALTWILMAAFELDEEPVTGALPARIVTHLERLATPRIRRRLVRTFLDASGVLDDARRVLAATAEFRLNDRNIRPGEADAIRALVERESRP